MKRKNMIAMVTSLALVGVVAVGGTLALLNSESQTLKNTFTVGDGYDDTNKDFIVQEHVVQQEPNGSYVKEKNEEDEETNQLTKPGEGQGYNNLVSNTTLYKDPLFTLRDASADGKTPPESWVVAKLDQADIAAMKQQQISFADGSVSTNWYLVTGTREDDTTWTYAKATTQLQPQDLNNLAADTDDTKYYFVYSDTIEVGESTQPLFTLLSVGNVNADTKATNLDVFGVAVQYVEGASLANDLDQIVGAAAGTLDKAVAASRSSQP